MSHALAPLRDQAMADRNRTPFPLVHTLMSMPPPLSMPPLSMPQTSS